MRRCSQERRGSVDKGKCRVGIEPRNELSSGRRPSWRMRKGHNCHDDSFESVVSPEEGSCRTLARVRPETSWMVLVIILGNYLRSVGRLFSVSVRISDRASVKLPRQMSSRPSAVSWKCSNPSLISRGSRASVIPVNTAATSVGIAAVSDAQTSHHLVATSGCARRLMRMLRTSWVSVEIRVLLYVFIMGNSSTLRVAGTARS